MVILPPESVEIIFRELARGIERRSPLLRPCQELLIVIAETFPVLLTHPGTIDALVLNMTTKDPTDATNALKILAAIHDRKALTQVNKKTAR